MRPMLSLIRVRFVSIVQTAAIFNDFRVLLLLRDVTRSLGNCRRSERSQLSLQALNISNDALMPIHNLNVTKSAYTQRIPGPTRILIDLEISFQL